MSRSLPAGRRLVAAGLAALIVLTLSASVARAHEHREVGEYEFTVGFLNEPALVNEPNGLSLAVQLGHGDEGTPVEGLAETLQAEIIFGDETRELELRAAFGEPGSYVADVIPVEPGTYSFRIFGTIDGMEVDETFTGGPDTFSEVEDTAALEFPDAGATGPDAATLAEDAQDTADTAQVLAIIGIIVGVVGVALGLAGALAARNARRPAAPSTAAPDPAD